MVKDPYIYSRNKRCFMEYDVLMALLFNPFSCVAWIYLFMFVAAWWSDRKKA